MILDAETGQVVDANPFLISLLGYTHADFLRKNVWDLGPFKDIDVSKGTFKELQDKDYVRYDDLPLQTRDGRLVYVEFVSNVCWVGQTKVILRNSGDITQRKGTEEERKKLEAQLQASRKKEAIGSLAAGVAHDFNNLLSVLLSYTELAIQMPKPNHACGSQGDKNGAKAISCAQTHRSLNLRCCLDLASSDVARSASSSGRWSPLRRSRTFRW